MYYTLFHDNEPRMELVHTPLISIRKQCDWIGRLYKARGEVLKITREGSNYIIEIGDKNKVVPRLRLAVVKQS